MFDTGTWLPHARRDRLIAAVPNVVKTTLPLSCLNSVTQPKGWGP